MAVTTKIKYQTSDNKYYDTEKEASFSQSLINNTNLIPWREEQYNTWLVENAGENDELTELLKSGATDGKKIQSIVCDAIISNIKSLSKLAIALSHEEEGLKKPQGPAGPKGADGNDGVQGPVGPAGADGNDGE